ncbi:MAG TPA: hypothetical protein VEX36_05940 [Thermoleophilaceae bacterium]|nr:hypothetical protein [Thermoleophilaceae bacterium]
MQGKAIGSPAEEEIAADGEILRMLLIDWRGPWTVDEIGRQMDSPVEAADGVTRLARAGLVHRLDRFVFPTRTAARAAALND